MFYRAILSRMGPLFPTVSIRTILRHRASTEFHQVTTHHREFSTWPEVLKIVRLTGASYIDKPMDLFNVRVSFTYIYFSHIGHERLGYT